MKTALLFGASGLVGSHLLNQLIKDTNYSKIKLFVRSLPEISDSKVQIIKIDFNKESCFKVHLKRILLFRELGGLGIGFLKEIIDLNKESSPSLEDCLEEITDFNKESPHKELS